MDAYLKVALKAAKRAADWINHHAQRLDQLTIEEKQARDYVSEVDTGAEERIMDTIQQAFPGHALVAEESGGAQKDSEFRWIIDPLDGTINFLHGVPQYAVSIALEHKGRLTHGVVWDVTKREVFTAIAGQGAFLNQQPIQVSSTRDLAKSLAATGFIYRTDDLERKVFCQISRFSRQTSGIRRAGSAALDLAWVAAGRYDFYWEYALHSWDIAAGALLVQEAGGQVKNLLDEGDFLSSGSLLAVNNALCEGVYRQLRACD